VRQVVAGVDLGGTGSRFIIQGPGGILRSLAMGTGVLGAGGIETRLDRFSMTIRDLLPADTRLIAVGIGATGPVDRDRGVVLNPDTLPWFSELPLTAGIQNRLGVPVIIDNDAVTAAIGEFRSGAGEGASRLLMVTLGTGIGAAFLLDGKPFRGPDGTHPEAGHIPILTGTSRCYCGINGCWESFASRSALQAMLRPHVPSALADSEILPQAAKLAHESELIKSAFHQYGRYLGRGLSILHTVYGPHMTVLGGSASQYLPLFVKEVYSELGRTTGFGVASKVRVAALGDNAGAIGAAFLARDLVYSTMPPYPQSNPRFLE
jgi:glucokinase